MTGNTDFSFLLDRKNGVEYWLYDYTGSDIFQQPGTVEQKPYGTLLMSFIDMDAGILAQMSELIGMFEAVPTVKVFTARWDEYRRACDELRDLSKQLPAAFNSFNLTVRAFAGIFVPDLDSGRSCTKADIAKMTGQAKILRGYCDVALARHTALYEEIRKGSFERDKHSRVRADRVLNMMGDDKANLLINSDMEARCLQLGGSFRVCHALGADLSTLLSVVLIDLVNNNLELVSCQHCGRPFVSSGKTVYCDRIANNKGDTCRTLGPLAKYEKTVVEQPVIGAHRRAYKKYYGWLLKGQITRVDFDAWRDEAKIKLELAKSGKLQKDVFLDWLRG